MRLPPITNFLILQRQTTRMASTQSPHPEWVPLQKQPSPFAEHPFVGIVPSEVPSTYALLIRYEVL